jgi:hypothetical protein
MHFRIVSLNKYYLAHQIKMGISVERHFPAALHPGMRPGIHCVVGFVGPRTDLDVRGKSCTPPGIDPQIIQVLGSNRYTD